MPQLELAFLGPPEIKLDGHPIKTDRRKAIALLAYLAVTRKPHTRDQLASLFWPDYEQASAYAYLRRTLWELNKILGTNWIEADRERVAFKPDSDVQLDTDVFEKRLEKSKENDLSTLEQAIALYRGNFLNGFFVADTAPFEEWQIQQAEYFRRELLGALETLIDRYAQAGMPEKALSYAHRWSSLDQLNEAAHRAIMRLQAGLGDRSAAVHQYESCVQVLKKELNVPPQPETTALYEKILRGDFGGTPFGQTQTLSVEHAAVSHLPNLSTPFMGRRPEVEEIKALIMSPDRRLLTLIGPGGIGKTRLSIQSASELVNQFPDGVWFVPLAPVLLAAEIIPAMAKALEFSFFREEERPRQQLLDYLREKRLLLILDNFEHLVREGAVLIGEILATAKHLKLLVTSRERLNLQGEQLYRVTGMRTPNATEAVAWIDAEELAKPFSALQLFAERAKRVRPDFRFTQDNLAAVTDICKLVDGMPLGIELAAAWVEVLTPKEIAAEVLRSLDFLQTDLQDVADRQRSIRAVFESSWRLLSKEEQEVFQALTVFRGSFSREAAQRVSGASLRMLLGLANKSWLQQVEEGRFQLHDVLRTYCYQHLQSDAEAWQTANDRHAEYYVEFVEALERDLRGPKQIEAVNILNKEFGTNIQAAWDWLIEQKRFANLVDKMLPGIFHFGLIRSQAATVTAMTKRARKAMPTPLDRESLLPWVILGSVECAFELSWGVLEDQPKERLLKLWETVETFGLADEMGYWFFVLMLGYREGIDFHQEFEKFQETLQKTRLKNDPWVLGYALLLAPTLSAADETQRKNYLIEALNVFQQIGVVHEQASTLQSLGEVAWLKNSFEEALHLKQAALELFEKAGDQFGQGWAWFDLAQIYLAQGNFERALHPFQEQRRIYERIGNRRLVGVNLSWVSLAASRYGTLEYALETRQKSLKIAQEENNLNDYVWAVWEMGELYRLMGDLEQARIWYRKSLPDFERLQDNIGIGFYHRGLGDLALGRKQWEEACGQFRTALDAFAHPHRSSSTWGLIYAQAGLGRSLAGLGEISEAGEILQNSIRQAQELKSWDLLYVPLLGMAELYAATGRWDRAMELATFIVSQPISWNQTRSQARAVIEIVSRDLPREIAQAAQVHSQSMTLEEAVTFVLQGAA